MTPEDVHRAHDLLSQQKQLRRTYDELAERARKVNLDEMTFCAAIEFLEVLPLDSGSQRPDRVHVDVLDHEVVRELMPVILDIMRRRLAAIDNELADLGVVS